MTVINIQLTQTTLSTDYSYRLSDWTKHIPIDAKRTHVQHGDVCGQRMSPTSLNADIWHLHTGALFYLASQI